MLDQQAPNQRYSNGANDPGDLVDTTVDRSLRKWHNVGHDDQAQGENTATSNCLNSATGQQLIESPREAAEYSAYCEEEEGGETEGAAAEDVG